MKIKRIAGLFCLVIMLLALTTQCVSENGNGHENGNENHNGNGSDNEPNTEKPGLSGKTSMELTGQMGAGWNLGNTLDSHWGEAYPWTASLPLGQETLWGNPKTTKAMIEKVKEAGFKTVRVPVTWYIATGSAPNYTINNTWMNRVQEIVDYVIDNDMFCILNLHHEDKLTDRGYSNNGWLYFGGTGTVSESDKTIMKNRMGKLWEQIAERFKDYDEYLIFEGLNEPGMHENGGWTSAKATFLNELLQIFVNTVRAGGGKNPERHLMIPPYCAAIDMWGDKTAQLNAFLNGNKPRVTDSKNKLIVSLHYYEPYGFCMAKSNDTWYRSVYNTSDGHISGNVNSVLSVIKNFTDKGIPVVMGETGASGTRAEAERVKWANDYLKKVNALGVPVVLWDDGGDFKLLNRSSRTWYFPNLTKAIVDAAK